MQLKKFQGEWFQSWQHLEFDYSNLGLTLMAGKARAGKSTLLDGPCWTLFGQTSKDSAADDVRSWSGENQITKGILEVEDEQGSITVVRNRGSATQNDLYFTENGSEVRGKDMRETQKLLEVRLGTSSALWIEASYLHQFSSADTFFISTAKNRRSTLEKVADLSIAVKLGQKVADTRKVVKKELEKLEIELSGITGRLDQSKEGVVRLKKAEADWDKAQADKINTLRLKSETFDLDRRAKVAEIVGQVEVLSKQIISEEDLDRRDEQVIRQLRFLVPIKKEYKDTKTSFDVMSTKLTGLLDELDRLSLPSDNPTCPVCLGPANNEHRRSRVMELERLCFDLDNKVCALNDKVTHLEEALATEEGLHKASDKVTKDKELNQARITKVNEFKAKLQVLRAQVNRFDDQILALEKEVNPHTVRIKEEDDSLCGLEAKSAEISEKGFQAQVKHSRLNWLYDRSFLLRGALLQKAVRQLNEKTNAYLEKYFDAELRFRLTLKNDDELEVEINNKGYSCPYKQLSGSERRMLSFCFSIAFMQQAQNTAGKKFNLLMLDEALNHMDPALKVCAFRLLQSLEAEYDSIILVDHCEEFKNLFDNKYTVVNDGTASELIHEQS